jgi:predicted Zn-dependent protease with MMP-like domain
MNITCLTIFIISFNFLSTPKDVFSQTVTDGNAIEASIPPNDKTGDYLDLVSNEGNNKQVLRLFVNDLIFDVKPVYDNGMLTQLTMSKKPDLQGLYDEIELSGKSSDIVFIYPSFTQAAYDTNGFYDYYSKKCDSKCLTVKIPDKVNGFQSSSINGAWALKLLDYPHIKDQDVDKNPAILKQYKRVIVLHNEYVTKREFDAITSHPNVIFLYPNALYAEVKSDYNSNTITLVRGHGYPDENMGNGFDWKYDASKNEYNLGCENWHFYKRENYTILNCYPEYRILYDVKLIKSLQSNDPTNVRSVVVNWLTNVKQHDATSSFLQGFGIEGKHVPHWVQNTALMLLDERISINDFIGMMIYLYEKNIFQ